MPINLTGLASGLDTDSMVKELMKVQRFKSTKVQKNITSLEWKQEKWKDLNSKIYGLYTGSLYKMKMQGTYNAKKASSSDEKKVSISANTSAPEGSHTIQVKSIAKAQYLTGNKLDTNIAVKGDTKLADLGMTDAIGGTIHIKGKEEKTIEITSDTTVADFLSTLKGAGLNAQYDSNQKRFFISSKESGMDNAFTIETSSEAVDLSKLGLSQILKTTDEAGNTSITAGSNVALVKPSDAVIVYNEAVIKSSSNVINANGLNITVKDVTAENEVINITVTKDIDAVYDNIKEFVKNYNSVLKELNDSYHADSSRGYEPLTDEEKEAMTESQVEKWESKIKSSLLRRDGSVNKVAAAMRDAMSQGIKIGEKTYSLASFGISSVDYTERGLLHIKGNTEDSLVGYETDELKKAITENPEIVTEVFTKVAGDLYDAMTKQMKSSELNSALTFYNDKEMARTLKDYKDNLNVMEKRLTDIERRYYKQFSAMESMLAKLNSQSSSLSSIIGVNSQ